MNKPPDPVTVDEQDESVTIRLPARHTVAASPLNALNVTLLVIGSVFALAGFSGLLNGLLNGLINGLVGDAETIAAWLWPLIPLPIGSVLLLAGLDTVIGRTEIRVDGRTLAITERVGPFHLTRRRPVEDVARLRLRMIDVSPQHHDYDKEPPKVVHLLRMDADHGRSTTITFGYPRDVLEPAAREIAGHIQNGAAVPVVVEQFNGEMEGGVPADPERSPPGCSPRISREGGRFSLYLPAPGFRGPLGTMAILTAVGLVIVLIIAAATVVHAVTDPDPGDVWIAWIVLGAKAGLLLILTAALINKSCTQVIFDVEDGRLIMSRKSLVRTRQWTWLREKIREVRCHDPTHFPNQPYRRAGGFELQIVSPIGLADGRLKGRRREELEWIAGVLNRELAVGPPGEADGEAEVDASASSPDDARRADAEPA